MGGKAGQGGDAAFGRWDAYGPSPPVDYPALTTLSPCVEKCAEVQVVAPSVRVRRKAGILLPTSAR